MNQDRLTGVIVGVGFVGVLLSTWLVFSQLFRGPTCPELFGVPACFLVLGSYALATPAAWFPESRRATLLFYVGAGAALLIAVYGSSSQLQGTVTCPSFEGLPMCFTSFLAAATMIGADVLRRTVAR